MNAYISNRKKNRPEFPEDREKFGTEFLDAIGDRINETAFGRFRQEGLQKQADLQKKVYESSPPLMQKVINAYTTPNRIEQKILKGISDATQIDERISTPLTYAAITGGLKGASKIKPRHLGIKQTIEPYTPPKGLGKVPRKMVNITDQVDEVFNMPTFKVQDIVKVAKRNKISYKQAEEYLNLKLKGVEPKGTLKPGSSRLSRGYKKGGLFDPNRDDTIMYSSTLSEDPTPPKKRKERRIGIDVSSNEKIKQSLLKDEQIELPPTYLGGQKEFRDKADFFDVSAAIIGGGKEDMINPATGKYFDYDRLATTEFGKTEKSKNRAIIFNHIKKNIGAKNITLEEFNKYADEQVAAETDLRNAIRLLNLKSYAANRYVDLSPYKTKEEQLAFLGEINRAKRPPKRRRDKETKEFTEDIESFEARYKIWEMDTAPYQQYTDYKETFDYGHIISAKSGFRMGDMGMNRISNTEIEAAHNIVSRDPATQKKIEILQEGNRERGARRDYLPSIQMMRNTSATVIEDFVKWKANQPGAEGPNLTKILDKFMPREQHDNYLKFVKKRFEERRSVSGSLRQFMEYELGIPYEDYLKFPNRLKLKVKDLYSKDRKESGDVIGMQQYMQGQQYMQEAADEFINLHHFDKNKRLRTTKEDTQLQDIPKDMFESYVAEDQPKTYQDLLNEILSYE